MARTESNVTVAPRSNGRKGTIKAQADVEVTKGPNKETVVTTRGTNRKAVEQAADKAMRTQNASPEARMVAPPHVHKSATVTAKRKVKKARVIVVENATYRGTTFSGTLELTEGQEVKIWRDKSTRVQVECKWYEWAPTRGGLRIAIPGGQWEIKEGYTGDVVATLGQE